jgi:hypothetical protein
MASSDTSFGFIVEECTLDESSPQWSSSSVNGMGAASEGGGVQVPWDEEGSSIGSVLVGLATEDCMIGLIGACGVVMRGATIGAGMIGSSSRSKFLN